MKRTGKRGFWGYGLAVVFGMMAVAQANGESVTFYFSGRVTHVDAGLDSAFRVGMPIVGHYCFESTALGFVHTPSEYDYVGAVQSVCMTLGRDYTVQVCHPEANYIGVADDVPPTIKDVYVVASLAEADTPRVDGHTLASLVFMLWQEDEPTDLLTDTALPLEPPCLTEAVLQHNHLYFDNEQLCIGFELDTLTTTPPPTVPTPLSVGGGVLLLSGCVVACRRRR